MPSMNRYPIVIPIVWMLSLLNFVPEIAAQNQSLASETTVQSSKVEVVLASEVNWKALNPARGDRSPQAGTLWGDQTKDGESGFLVKFVDGFSSPPHIHNITYRGIVIGGLLHNDDPDATNMWMKEGSYWTQPAGEVHITSARGSSIGYVEIQSGPYLVKPSSEAFDNGEKPVNVDATNIVWLTASETSWIKQPTAQQVQPNAEITFMWGDPEGEQTCGSMVKLPPGFSGKLEGDDTGFKIIVISGKADLKINDVENVKTLTAGSYVGANGKTSLELSVGGDKECIIYVRTSGKYIVGRE